jgi:hypothetical protein
MSAHTPGPWYVKDGTRADVYCEDRYGNHRNHIAKCWNTDEGSAVDNARLIAAAPDLLAALIEAVKDVEDHISGLRANHPYKLAISKATGV